MGDRVAVMKKGVLQQVAAPQTLYDRPVNLFVAGFIGSPAMNLVRATLEEEHGALYVRLGDQRLHVDDSVVAQRPALRRYAGSEVVFGVRPEDLEDATLAPEHPADRRLRSSADLVEAMGSDVNVHFPVQAPFVLTEDTRELARDVGGEALDELVEGSMRAETTFVGRFAPKTDVREGRQIEIAVDTTRLHFFDMESGASIWNGTG